MKASTLLTVRHRETKPLAIILTTIAALLRASLLGTSTQPTATSHTAEDFIKAPIFKDSPTSTAHMVSNLLAATLSHGLGFRNPFLS